MEFRTRLSGSGPMGREIQTEPSWSGFWSGHPYWMMVRAVQRILLSQFPMKCSSKSIFDSCVNITDDEQGAGSVEIVLENGVDTSIRTFPFPYRLLSETEFSQRSRHPSARPGLSGYDRGLFQRKICRGQIKSYLCL